MIKRSGLVASLLLTESQALKSKQISSLEMDPNSHDDKDVNLYTQVMSNGNKFVENDPTVVKKREQAQKDMENPYFMATEDKDQNEVQQTSQMADQQIIKSEEEKDVELDLSSFVQIQDDMWGSMVQMNSMTDATIELNNPDRVILPSEA